MRMPAWLRQMLALLVRSAAFRSFLVVSLVAPFLTTAIAGIRQTGTLDPATEWRATAGSAKAAVTEPMADPVPPGKPLPVEPPFSLPDVDSVVAWSGVIPLETNGEVQPWSYEESQYPSFLTDNRATLVSGRWPSESGECVTNHTTAVPRPTVGNLSLRIVGQIDNVASAIFANTVLCAPGTWEQFSIAGDIAPFVSDVVQRTTYVQSGDLDRVLLAIQNDHPEWEIHTPGVAKAQVGEILSDIAPWLLVLAVASLAGAYAVGRWSGRHQKFLITLGGRGDILSRWIAIVLVATGLIIAFLGATLSAYLVRLGFPLIRRVWPDAVTQSEMNPVLSLVSALVVGASAVAGWFAGKAARPGRPVEMATAVSGERMMSSRTLVLSLGLILVGVVCGVGIYRFEWGMIGVAGAAGGLGVGAACLTAWLVRRLGQRAARDGSSRALAARLFCDVGHSGIAGGFAAVFTVLLVVTVAVTGLGYARYKMAFSSVPPGFATVEMQALSGEAVPKRILSNFEHDIRADHPITVHKMLYCDDGDLWGFDSVDDAQVAFGRLSQTQQEFLTGGGALMQAPPPPNNEFVLSLANRRETAVVGMATMEFTPARGHEFQVPGFYLTSALPKEAVTAGADRSHLLYSGLDAAHDQIAREWPQRQGVTGVRVQAYHAPTMELVSNALVISLVGFGLVVVAVSAGVLRREARLLRPLASGLLATGISHRWIQTVLLWLVSGIIAVPLLMSTTLAVAFGGCAWIGSPRQVNLAAVPWAAMAVMGVAVVAAGALGALLVSRGLRPGDRLRELQ